MPALSMKINRQAHEKDGGRINQEYGSVLKINIQEEIKTANQNPD